MFLMNTKIGIDIVRRKRFMQSLKRGSDSFSQHIFTAQEIRQNTKEQLASIFCLKEAVIKALELPQDVWLSINTNRKDNGKVYCSFLDSAIANRVASIDTSISHEGEWIIGVVVVVLQP